MQIDNKNVRQSLKCPICLGIKDRGLVACWGCYRAQGMRYGNAEAEAKIAAADKVLEVAQ